MALPAGLTDAELREELIGLGATVGPITATTRSLYEKQLEKRRAAASGGGAASTPSTKRVPSKSPSRVTKKTVTSSVEIVKKKVSSDRRSSTGLRTHRSELEDEAGEPELVDFPDDKHTNETKEQVVKPVTRATRLSVFSEPKESPTKKSDNIIYPGLSTPASLVAPSTASKLAERKPTPPRATKISTPSYVPQHLLDRFSSGTGVFSDITSDFSSRSRKRPAFTYLPGEKPQGRDFVGRLDVDDEYYDDEDDDHLETSRIIAEPKHIQSSIFSSVSRLPTYAYDAVSAPFKKAVQKTPTYDIRRGYKEREKSVQVVSQRSGSDVANYLLYSMTFLFLLLSFGYFTAVHTEKVVNIGVAATELAKDTIAFFYTYAILPSVILAVVGGLGAVVYILNQRLVSAKAERRKRVFDLVEKITDIIRNASTDGQEYIAEPHVRDMLIPASKRMRNSAEWRRWQEAVDFINQNDSRVSTESRIINGVECAVWRWVPANKAGWQGSAFDGRTQLNVPDHALSHCLKLRGMFPSPQSFERDGADVGRSLVQKLNPIRPLHVHVENGSKEGVVFVRFATLPECKAAFTSLHGCWFNGQLVSAKYLRDERYEQRFPSAPRNASEAR